MGEREKERGSLTEVEHCAFGFSLFLRSPLSTPIPCGFVYVRRLCCVSVINEITLFLLLLPPTGISCFCFLLLAFVFVFYYISLLLLLLSCLLLRLVLLPVGMQTVASARSSTSSLAMVYLLLLKLLTVYLLSWAEFAASAVLPLQLALPTLLKFQMHSAGFGFQLRWDTNGVRLFLATASDFLDSFDYCLRAENIYSTQII